MNAPVIEVDGIGKRYPLRYKPPGDLRELLSSAALGLLRRRTPAVNEQFDALQDVSFRTSPGEVLGVIGRNGSGKSTLLKILSGVTAPTTGRARLVGRLGCLLEVGSSMHPELSGRENIYFYGALLGMTRARIRASFDQIVAFAEVGPFLDMPVKRYSSGMNVRLGFSIAAHLEPDILLVDEALSVGDAAFRRKCLKQVNQIAAQGCTVLLVSHDLPAVTKFCSRVLVLEAGKLVLDGPTETAIDYYLNHDSPLMPQGRSANAAVLLTGVRVESLPNGSKQTIALELRLTSEIRLTNTFMRLTLFDSRRTRLGAGVLALGDLDVGAHHIRVRLPPGLLHSGSYTADVTLIPEGSSHFSFREAVQLVGPEPAHPAWADSELLSFDLARFD
jgi:lipopolysaccharide transport system ATP-binding protein